MKEVLIMRETKKKAEAKSYNLAKTDTGIRIGEVRFSYARVLEPNDKGKYSCCILIPQEDEEALDLIEDAIEAAKQKGSDRFWKGKVPKDVRTPLRDGDEDHPEDDAFAGMMFLNASNNYQPKVVKKDDFGFENIDDPAEFYSGCWGAVTLEFYPYDNSGNRGVAVSLGNILKTRDDTRLAGTVETADSSFGDLAD